MSSQAAMPATRRHLKTRQAETVRKILDAARDELRATDYEALTVRAVAARAEVAPATAYTYFSSKNHLLVELFWRRINELESVTSSARTPRARVIAIFRQLAEFLAAEPDLAAAVTLAMLSPEPDVRQLRFLIGTEINTWIATAAGDAATPELLDLLGLAWTGAMLQAGLGHAEYADMGDRLAAVTNEVMKATP